MIIERYKTKCLTLKIIDVFHIILLLHHILQNKTWRFLKNAGRDKNIFFLFKGAQLDLNLESLLSENLDLGMKVEKIQLETSERGHSSASIVVAHR